MIGIVCATYTELFYIKKIMNDIKTFECYEYSIFAGKLNNVEVVLINTGIGNVRAALGVSILKFMFSIDFVILIGIGGIVNKELKIGDVVIGKCISYYDCYQYSSEKFVLLDFKQDYFCEDLIIEKIIKLLENETLKVIFRNNIEYKPKLIAGKIITGDVPIVNSAIREDLYNIYQADCVDMEAASVAQTANLFKISFLVIRIMSDYSDEKSYISVLRYEDYLCRFIASVLGKIISKL